MKRTAVQTFALIATVAAVVGCQSSRPQFAWWKNDKSPEDTSAVARSAKPVLPSTQTKPEAVAVAGLTPGAPPSASNLAAAGTPAAAGAKLMAPSTPLGATALAASPPGAPPNVSIPVSPGTLANAPAATYPADGLADKLVATPRPGAAPPGATSPATVAAAGSAAGPYDPNGYKPSATLAGGPDGNAPEVDRYGIGSAKPAATAMAATAPASLPVAKPEALTSDPADRYGSPRSTVAATPDTTPLMDPAAVAADRYSNQKLPTLGTKTPDTPPVAAATPATAATTAGAVRLASAPGQYRPGKTSSYSVGTASATTPIEIASRPSPPTPSNSTTPTTVPANTPSAVSQPWTPPATTAPPAGRTY